MGDCADTALPARAEALRWFPLPGEALAELLAADPEASLPPLRIGG